MENITDLFVRVIEWEKTNSLGVYRSTIDGYECILELGDFPEEPMWTLTYRNKSFSFDVEPEQWRIPE